KPVAELAARHAVKPGGHVHAQARSRIVGDGRLRIPITPIAVQKTAFRLEDQQLVRWRPLTLPDASGTRLRVLSLRFQPAAIHDRQSQLVVSQHERREVDYEGILVPDAKTR